MPEALKRTSTGAWAGMIFLYGNLFGRFNIRKIVAAVAEVAVLALLRRVSLN
jgi:hypothetical protein